MSCYDSTMRWNQGCAITCMIARRIQGYICGYTCGGESERAPPAGVGVYMWLCGIVCVAAGEREKERGKGEREKQPFWSKPLDKHRDSTPLRAAAIDLSECVLSVYFEGHRATRSPLQCVECLIGKQKKPTLFKVTEPSSYRTELLPRAPVCVDCLFLRSPSRVPYQSRSASNGHGHGTKKWTVPDR